MKTAFEQAMSFVQTAHRKNSKSLAWAWAQEAADIAGVEVFGDEEFPGWPDLRRLEKDIRTALNPEPVIVTRHQGVIDWLNALGIEGKVIAHATPEDVEGKVIYGNLPLHLASLAARVYTIAMPDLKPEQRGEELFPSEMDQAGAVLQGYTVCSID